MTPRLRLLLAVLVVGSALTGCTSAPSPQPTPSASSSPSASASPSASPSSSSSPAPTETPPPPLDPPPSAVTGLTATMGGGSGEVLLRWTQNPEQDVVSYIVLRTSTPGGPMARIGTVTRQEVTQFEVVPFVDSETTVGYYRVRAVDAAGQEGPDSIEVCGASVGNSC